MKFVKFFGVRGLISLPQGPFSHCRTEFPRTHFPSVLQCHLIGFLILPALEHNISFIGVFVGFAIQSGEEQDKNGDECFHGGSFEASAGEF